MQDIALAVRANRPTVSPYKRGGPSPQEKIKLFFYGDRIHWGDKRQEYEELMKEPVPAASSEYEYLVVCGHLALFYMGYSWLLEHLLPDDTEI